MNQGKWICSPNKQRGPSVTFSKSFSVEQEILSAELRVTAMGIYRVKVNGTNPSKQVLAPGWTSYGDRIQVETLDVTELLQKDNRLDIAVGSGWAVGRIGLKQSVSMYASQVGTIAELTLEMKDGTKQVIATGEDWEIWTHPVTFSDIYDGETIDYTVVPEYVGHAKLGSYKTELIDWVGAPIMEQETLAPVSLIVTPKGERVLDFGQNLAGTVSLRIRGKRGERVVLSCGEVLDKDGNFYNANYRSAKSLITFVLSGEEDYFKPEFSFQGFRYLRIEEYPDQEIDLNGFRAIVIHSEMTRTGRFACGDAQINQLYHNIIWGHKSNYLDIPTDCPQRDERLGWTGDTQAFCRTAAINYDVRKFFEKWLGDLRIEQGEDGSVHGICPERLANGYTTRTSAGWGDVATIVPWTLYQTYGDKKILEDNLEMMRKWVEYMHHTGPEEFLWLGGYHYGDWLAMDAGEDSYVGATSNDLVASAFFAYSADLLVRAGEELGKDMSEYRTLHANIVKAFRSYFMENGMPKEEFPYTEIIPGNRTAVVDTVRKGMTQTAIVLILHFNLCTEEERPALVDKLCELIDQWGGKMTTGFLGTPYILHVLTENGRNDMAYKLFFAEENPSWLYSVNHGATTMWEHWNGIKEDGTFWSTDMNSYNHYAYGAVGDWMYGKICGVEITEPGYKKIRLEPHPCERLGFAKCAIDTVQGRLESHWYYMVDRICFEFTVPAGTVAEIVLPNGKTETVGGGSYCYSIQR